MAGGTAAQALVERARDGDGEAFRQLTDPYRSELQVHCYRMLGSVQDAEDLVQETLLAAWRGSAGTRAGASVRTWLYRIATNRCLNALRDSSRRAARREPIALEVALPEPTRRLGEPGWLEPYPDVLLAGVPDGRRGPRRATRRGSRCRSRSWWRCSTCRPGSGRSWCCGTCSATGRRRSRRCWGPAGTR